MITPRAVKRKQCHDVTDQPLEAPQKKQNTVASPPIQQPSLAPIKKLCSQQRSAQSNEETCCVCGRYGEYINDDTDHDVCSLECKQIDTSNNVDRVVLKSTNANVKINAIEQGHVQHTIAEKVHVKWTAYRESKDLQQMTKQQRRLILKAHDLVVHGKQLPRPIASMDQLKHVLGDQLHHNVTQDLDWHIPTSIQRMAIPVGLAGNDVHVIAPTHSGKTGSYLIPIITHCLSLNRMNHDKRRYGPYALIVVPTRDLAIQVETIAKTMVRQLTNMRTSLLVGGQPLSSQVYRLHKGVQLIIATPGRLSQIATYHPQTLRLWRLSMVVLDEADAMLGLGFGKEINKLLRTITTSAKHTLQLMLYSATAGGTSDQIRRITRYLTDVVTIQLTASGSSDSHSASPPNTSSSAPSLLPTLPTPNVRQTVLWIENKSKPKRLYSILNNPKYFMPPILIFVESRLGAEFLAQSLTKRFGQQLSVVAMHADKDPEEREAVVANLTRPNVSPSWDVVVSTDILARGMDLPLVRLVINYDMASTLDDYIHRVGRAVLPTGPGSSSSNSNLGCAITFVNQDHQALLPPFMKMLSNQAMHQVTPLPPQLKRFLP
ncbi:DEAD-domain-containing protein [Hesseltinella vesiculosa]|uniref:RNA helicase n=1 Tax=Hesseltinella vesiculosa TaxID=101127 RepID=A0A1X2GWX0_9FUNG|nr:DEAD-domain-containing protein [Hesseltinella vesiculosa]